MISQAITPPSSRITALLIVSIKTLTTRLVILSTVSDPIGSLLRSNIELLSSYYAVDLNCFSIEGNIPFYFEPTLRVHFKTGKYRHLRVATMQS
jgi:hypothetical protein